MNPSALILTSNCSQSFVTAFQNFLETFACSLHPACRKQSTYSFQASIIFTWLRTIDIISRRPTRDDIAIYVRAELKDVGKWAELGDNWPDEQLLSKFTETAEGLFLWVSYSLQSISATPLIQMWNLSHSYPNAVQTVVAPRPRWTNSYMTILKTCNWDDVVFMEGYTLLMGAIMGGEEPSGQSRLSKCSTPHP